MLYIFLCNLKASLKRKYIAAGYSAIHFVKIFFDIAKRRCDYILKLSIIYVANATTDVRIPSEPRPFACHYIKTSNSLRLPLSEFFNSSNGSRNWITQGFIFQGS